MLRTALLVSALAAGLAFSASAAEINFHANMTGAQEVPPKDSKGTGEVRGAVDPATKEMHYTVTWQGLSGPATAAHFHGPADSGANAGVVVPIGGKNPTSPANGSAQLTEAQLKDLMAGKMYVNVHTAANPGGEIRGQVVPDQGGAASNKGASLQGVTNASAAGSDHGATKH